jgi:hypothetical protein
MMELHGPKLVKLNYKNSEFSRFLIVVVICYIEFHTDSRQYFFTRGINLNSFVCI